jgi:predicted Zn-dependent peptidase|tara:strand:- start:1392 stop:1769 length:378 start_codon:yes stop_codon:yes gene_type:complete
MAEVYTNLPEKEKDSLLTTIDNLTKNQNTEPFSLNQNDYDAAIAFFVKRGFGRESAEKTAYIILRQAKIDSINPQELLDQLTKATPVQLSELITVILNANRVKTSRLGTRTTKKIVDIVNRTILD